MATEEGIVCRIDATTAWIATMRSSACETCASRGSCSTLGSGREEMEVQAVNTAGAQVGDRVVISLKTASLFKLSFLLYIFPILTLFAGALLGQMAAPFLHFDATSLSVVCAFLFFLLAFGLVRLGGNRLAKKDAYRPKVVRILKQNI